MEFWETSMVAGGKWEKLREVEEGLRTAEDVWVLWKCLKCVWCV